MDITQNSSIPCSRNKIELQSGIRFHVGEIQYTVESESVLPETTLNTYLRDKLHLTATKKMCLEGGCGTCIVAVEEIDSKGKRNVFAVNSCLVSIFSCHGWKILSNEGIGDPVNGYNQIQKLLASNNGSQCGFCSSGMVMNMYALYESGGKTRAEIENSFGGNLCRCTGYRPILTAFKQLATDSDDIIDIDDLEDLAPCKKTEWQSDCPKSCRKTPLYFQLANARWLKVYFLKDLLDEIRSASNQKYMLVAGNTARGVYWPTSDFSPDLYIDISRVAELTDYSTSKDSVIIGANVSLTDTIVIFRDTAKKISNFVYLDEMADHLDLVAHVPVRNIGTIAGNLMIKYKHNEFPSDVFLIFETVNATVVIVDVVGNETRVSPKDFLQVNMHKKVIKQIILRPYGDDYYFTSYKIMPRAQNAHAMVNSGFLLQLNSQGEVQSASIVYGGINPQFIHATESELLLRGKILFDNNVLQSVFKSLDAELNPDWVLPDPTPKFRKQLAINLFYKYVLHIAPVSKISDRNRSGGMLLTRPVSSGSQQIYSKKQLYPLTQPILKLEALAQTSGQAKYIIDIPDLPNQLHAVLVKAQATPGSVLISIDASKALLYPGVMAFYSAKDIPGINSIALATLQQTIVEEIFCTGPVRYYSQPIGVVVAKSHDIAKIGASLITTSVNPPSKKPLITVRDVLQANEKNRITHRTSVKAKKKGNDIKKIIKGEVNLKGQYHFHMENQDCLVVPTESGLDVFAGTQWIDHIQGVIAQMLNMPSQKISCSVRRLGGAFGAKISRTSYLGAAAALAAVKLNQPVRIWMNLNDNMDIIGKRYPMYTEYEVGVNGKGAIQYLKANLYSDYGVGGNEGVDFMIVPQFQNCYNVDTWTFDTYTVHTDTPGNCFARAPGTFEAQNTIESIMEHISHTLGLDPLAVRRANIDKEHNQQLIGYIDDIVRSDNIDKRKADIVTYNKANRWKKRGLSVIPMRWMLEVRATFTTLVSIYHLDGGVVVTHGGIEMGQGINTKVAQVCAYKFGIPLEKVSVAPTYNVASANSFSTGGSITTEAVVYALLQACDVLLERIQPIRKLNPRDSWPDLIQKCYDANICLISNGYFSPTEKPGIQRYPIFGCCALELELDILTGKHEITRVDILEDVGQSMSPLIDIGQVEGAFIMGLSYHSTEELIYSEEGKLTNDRTWNYKPYGAKDIPQDFRIRFANNALNPLGVLNSKAIAEPPCCLTISFPLAIRQALTSARNDADPNQPSWYPIDGSTTVENVLLNTLDNYTQFTL